MVAWPIAKLLEFVLGPHHGIIYRRDGMLLVVPAGAASFERICRSSELKELINMHSAIGPHGGDLQSDTVTMIGGALDFQVWAVIHYLFPVLADSLSIQTRKRRYLTP